MSDHAESCFSALTTVSSCVREQRGCVRKFRVVNIKGYDFPIQPALSRPKIISSEVNL